MTSEQFAFWFSLSLWVVTCITAVACVALWRSAPAEERNRPLANWAIASILFMLGSTALAIGQATQWAFFLWLANLAIVAGYAALTDALSKQSTYLTVVVGTTAVAIFLILIFSLGYQARAGAVSLLIAAALFPCYKSQPGKSKTLRALRWILIAYSALLIVRAASALTPAFEAVDRAFFIYSLPHAIAVGCAVILAASTFRLEQEEVRRARLNTSNQTLATLADEQTSLIRLLSHEIKGPLSRAFGSLSATDTSTRHHLTEIQRWLYRLDEERELSGVLNKPEFTKITIRDLIERFSRIEPIYPEKIGAMTVRCDPFLLITALENLLENGVKYGGESKLMISGNTETIQFDVIDEGPGIPSEQVDQAFKRFSRLNASSAVSGTGQGLYWSRRVARLHGGDVIVKSTQPSVVQLWIPR